MRLFVAIGIAPKVRALMAVLAEELARIETRMKWVREENIHLTLKFLGEVEDARCGEVAEALARAAERAEPLEMTLAGVGGFPTIERPRVVHVPADGGAALMDLQAAVEREMAEVGFKPEGRAYTPHATIGRSRMRGGSGRLGAALGEYAEFKAGVTPVDEVVLLQSTLTKRGPIYDAAARARLGSRASE